MQRNPKLAEILVAVCQELYKIVSNLVDEKQQVRALTVITAVTRTLRSVLTKKRLEILAIVQELKTKIEPDLRPSLRIRPRYAPTNARSVQCWYNMIISMIYTGVTYMSTGQLHKQWLEENYQTNLVLIQSWFDSGFLTTDQLTEYKQLGDVIRGFSFGPAISTPNTVPNTCHK